VVFLDEPTTGLDPASRLTMWDAVGELVAAGTTIVLTTQYLEEADRLADRIVLIDGGRVVASGTADELKAAVGSERLELTFAAAPDAERAARVLGVTTVPDPAAARIALPTDGSAAHLHRVLDQLAAAGLGATRVTATRPTLDDVFLTLTAPAARTLETAR
jgi:ABC-2 type transport system ATP-binding protein